MNNEFKKQLIWFQANYIKIEQENQKFWINYHQSHLKNLEKFVFFISVFISFLICMIYFVQNNNYPN